MTVVQVRNDDGRQKLRTQADQFRKHPFWKIIVRHIDRLVSAEDRVIMTVGSDSEAKYTKRDLAVQRKQDLLDLVKLPETVLSEMEKPEHRDIEDDEDPYDAEE